MGDIGKWDLSILKEFWKISSPLKSSPVLYAVIVSILNLSINILHLITICYWVINLLKNSFNTTVCIIRAPNAL